MHAVATLLVLAFSPAVLPAPRPVPQAAAESPSALEVAVAAFEAGEWQRVLEVAAATPADPTEAARLAYLAGETQLILGRSEDAALSFRAVLAQRPAAVPAKVGLARALTNVGALDEAEELLTAVLAAEPEDVGGKTAMGLLLARRERFDEARAQLAAASKLAPTNAICARAYVEVLLRAEDDPAAAAVAEAFSKAAPEHPMGYFLLAVVMEREGDDEPAIEQYQRALAVDPNFLDAHKNLAILCHTLSNTYQDKQRTRMAYEHYERYFALGGTDAQLRATYESLLAYKDQILGS